MSIETKRKFPSGSWVIPTLVILVNVVWGIRVGTSGSGHERLSEVLGFILFVVPISVLFLLVYGIVLFRLRASPRPRREVIMLVLATIAGVGACVVGATLLMYLVRSGAIR